MVPTKTLSDPTTKKSAGGGALPDAFGGYTLANADDIEKYLSQHSDLLDFLAALPEQLGKWEDVESLELEWYRDPKDSWEKLFVLVRTLIEGVDERDALEDALFASLFQPKTELLSDRVIISVE